MKTTAQNRAPMNGHYRRADSINPTVVRPQRTLPPRETFAGHPEALAAWDVMTELNERIRHHEREARKSADAAVTAAAAYRAKVRAALEDGGDVSKIKDDTARHEAASAAHLGFAREATAQATRHGMTVLGPIVAQVAPETFPAAEARMDLAAEKVRAALDTLTETWGEWATAWGVRQHLSWAHYRGGPLVPFDNKPAVPREITAALAAIDTALASLDRLKADEQELTAWRDLQAAAAEQQRRQYAAG
jgi:hypothetical protein